MSFFQRKFQSQHSKVRHKIFLRQIFELIIARHVTDSPKPAFFSEFRSIRKINNLCVQNYASFQSKVSTLLVFAIFKYQSISARVFINRAAGGCPFLNDTLNVSLGHTSRVTRITVYSFVYEQLLLNPPNKEYFLSKINLPKISERQT